MTTQTTTQTTHTARDEAHIAPDALAAVRRAAEQKGRGVSDFLVEAAISATLAGSNSVRVVLDPYNPTGSTRYVNFTTAKQSLWATQGPPPKSHVNWVVYDSDWEAEFCRVAEAHPQVLAYAKNHSLGLEVPYRMGGTQRHYRPDFIVRVNDKASDGHEDPLNLVVEIKGFRGEDAIVKAETMLTQWVPGVNALGSHGRWAFAEFRSAHDIEAGFAAFIAASPAIS